jgi:hypothetical protein
MRKIRVDTPSPAMVVAIVTLIFAVTGTAVAGVATISVLSHKDKKTVKKIADKEIGKKAKTLTVANANKLGGQPASSYAPATTLRTALVAANGTVDAAHSDGVSQGNVTQPVGGVYCFNGLSPAPRSVVASVAGGQATVQTQTQYDPTSGVCAGSQFDVATVTDSNALFPEAFTVFIH